MNTPPDFDPFIAILGSLMFCAAPLFFAAYAASRRLGCRTDQLGLLTASVFVGILLFVSFLLALGPHGIYAAIGGSMGWILGFWSAARRNDSRRFYRSRALSQKSTHRNTRQE